MQEIELTLLYIIPMGKSLYGQTVLVMFSNFQGSRFLWRTTEDNKTLSQLSAGKTYRLKMLTDRLQNSTDTQIRNVRIA